MSQSCTRPSLLTLVMWGGFYLVRSKVRIPGQYCPFNSLWYDRNHRTRGYISILSTHTISSNKYSTMVRGSLFLQVFCPPATLVSWWTSLLFTAHSSCLFLFHILLFLNRNQLNSTFYNSYTNLSDALVILSYCYVVFRDPDAGKDWRQKEKRVAEDEMIRYITNSMDMIQSNLWEIVKDREAWCATVLGVSKCWTWLSNWTTTNPN